MGSLQHVAQLAQVLGCRHGHRTLFFVLSPSDLLNFFRAENDAQQTLHDLEAIRQVFVHDEGQPEISKV